MQHKLEHFSDLKLKEKSTATEQLTFKVNNMTEEYETYRSQSQNQQSNLLEKKKTPFQQCFECIQPLLNLFRGSKQKKLTVSDKNFMKLIYKMRMQKEKIKKVLPPLKQDKKTLVIDLDGILIWSRFQKPQKYDFCSQIPYKDRSLKMYTSVRYGTESFLFQMSKIYQIVLYTARRDAYVKKMIQKIDPKNRISHIILREHCIVVNKIHYLKNIKILGRNEKNVIFVDYDKLTGLLQPDNFYAIPQYHGQTDRQLFRLMAFLKDLVKKQSFLPVYFHFNQFLNQEIQLESTEEGQNGSNKENLDPEEIIKRYSHEKSKSETESFTINFEHEERSNIQMIFKEQ